MRSALIHAAPAKQAQEEVFRVNATLAGAIDGRGEELGNLDKFQQAELRLHLLNHQHNLSNGVIA